MTSTVPAAALASARPADHPILRRVLHAIHLGRAQGFHFPSNFLAISFDHVAPAGSVTTLKGAPLRADGGVDPVGLDVLADLALAASVRSALQQAVRLATVNLQLQFTGAACDGPLRAVSHFHGFLRDTAGQQAVASVSVRSGEREIALGSGTFMVLDLPPGARVPVLSAIEPPAEADWAGLALPAPGGLEESEAAIYAQALKALRTGGMENFSEAFWGFRTRASAQGASGTLRNGAHLGNRVGHVQGGVLLAFAQATAQAALPGDWPVSSVTAGFVSPGEGEQLRARSRIMHRGRTTAVVRTEITGVDRRRVLEVMTTHSLRKRETAQG
ncbi:acyl-CoA thioesterase domain-containing protein [Achromobacter aloeverae]